MECKKEKNIKECSCSYVSCEHRGLCCECVSYHRQRGEIPGCFFPPEDERSYDRSLAAFIRSQQKRT